jgi:hypothetical protein
MPNGANTGRRKRRTAQMPNSANAERRAAPARTAQGAGSNGAGTNGAGTNGAENGAKQRLSRWRAGGREARDGAAATSL